MSQRDLAARGERDLAARGERNLAALGERNLAGERPGERKLSGESATSPRGESAWRTREMRSALLLVADAGMHRGAAGAAPMEGGAGEKGGGSPAPASARRHQGRSPVGKLSPASPASDTAHRRRLVLRRVGEGGAPNGM